MSAQLDYWYETLSESCAIHGVSASDAQLKMIADDVRISHENHGLAFYEPPAEPNRELARLKQELQQERSLVFCKTCKGSGRIITYGGTFMSDSSCWNCNGRGKHKP